MLAVEKRVTSPLIIPTSIEKIVEIDTHISCAMSGLIADAKTLIDRARVEAQVGHPHLSYVLLTAFYIIIHF